MKGEIYVLSQKQYGKRKKLYKKDVKGNEKYPYLFSRGDRVVILGGYGSFACYLLGGLCVVNRFGGYKYVYNAKDVEPLDGKTQKRNL